MSDTSRGPGWWIASDGKWYPPESHPDYRPLAPPPTPPPPRPSPPSPPPRRPEAPRFDSPPPGRKSKPVKVKGGTSIWKVALGVLLGLFLFVIACSALIGGAANKVTNDAQKAATLHVETTGCWSVTLTGNDGQSQSEHCGPMDLPMPKGLGANAIVQKKESGGTLVATVIIGGKEKTRQTTNAEFGIVSVTR